MRSGSEVRSRRSVNIHPTALIHPDAEIGEGVEIGPYSCIAGTVKINARTIIGTHVVIEGYTTIGCDNEIFTGAVIGSRTQDKKFDGGISYLRIGDRNKIREYVTINPGTKDGTETVIGSDNLLMAYCHVAHDCIIKDATVLANAATLAGHVIIEDRATIGGLTGVHQFVRIGRLALIGGCSKVVKDVPPFLIADGHPAEIRGLNVIGLERAEVSEADRRLLKKAYKILFLSKLTLDQAVKKLEREMKFSPLINTMIEFLKNSERGISR